MLGESGTAAGPGRGAATGATKKKLEKTGKFRLPSFFSQLGICRRALAHAGSAGSGAPRGAAEPLGGGTHARCLLPRLPAGNMSAGRPFLACACFFSDNIFVGRYGLHVRYRDEAQLRREHGRVTAGRGAPPGPSPGGG